MSADRSQSGSFCDSQVGSHDGLAHGTPTYGTYGTDEEPPPLERSNPYVSERAHEQNTSIYVVEWPEHGIVKVGVGRTEKRWRPFVLRGGVVRYLRATTEERAYAAEWECQVALATAHFESAFTCQEEAKPFLGGVGRGWSECFRIGEGRSEELVNLLTARLPR